MSNNPVMSKIKGLYCSHCGFFVEGTCKPICPQCEARMKIWEEDVPRVVLDFWELKSEHKSPE